MFCVCYVIIAVAFLLTFLPDAGKDNSQRQQQQHLMTETVPLLFDSKQHLNKGHHSGDVNLTAPVNPQEATSFLGYVVFYWMTRYMYEFALTIYRVHVH